jgi:hypothetical protein
VFEPDWSGSVTEEGVAGVVAGDGATLLALSLPFVGATSTGGATGGVVAEVVDDPPAGVRAPVVSALV